MHVRASDVSPIRPLTTCQCESPICSAHHQSRVTPDLAGAHAAPDLSWLAARRSRMGLTAALRHRVIRHYPRHA